ncbi:nucleotidyltransferase family protein [Flexivirga caeni]|uniref:NDP-sugar synthase n=1 Tax=Flexivirga caeni TaxID=2294115 RepID=A0A3M9LVN0_9MICO|nr:nucleotidyltransferase family protein [Flexivirga caeni]RNI17292.1 NDP-sugar synthase [Flexivirga caeni]
MNVAAIVLAGGVGSRMRPLTDACPKPLLPLGAEPLVGYQLRRLAAVGVRRVVLATGYLAASFDAVLGNGTQWGLELTYSVEDQPLGTGGAMHAAAALLPDADRLVVLNGDLLSSHDLAAQLRAAPAGAVSVHVRSVADVAPYGQVVFGPDRRVTGFHEKSGRGPGWANAGTYVVPGDFLRTLPDGRCSWERDVLPAAIEGQARVEAWPADGYFRDVGDPTAYRQACVDAVCGDLPGGSRPACTRYVAASAVIAANARLTGGSSVHEKATVAAGAWLDGCVVLPGVQVGAGARLRRCVVAAGAVVAAGEKRTDAIVTGVPTRR